MNNPFDEAYFMNGPATGKSNYTNYSWLEERTMAFAGKLVSYLGIEPFDELTGPGDTVLDFGCSRGYTVKALNRLGVDATGYDISEWAITHCDPEVVGKVHNHIQHPHYDYILAKDCFEHIQQPELARIVEDLLFRLDKVLVIVPLSDFSDWPYVRKEDNQDSTHVIRWPLQEWIDFFQHRRMDDSLVVSGSWHVPGLKPTSLSSYKSCGFIRVDKLH